MGDLPERLAQTVAERVVALVVSALDLDALLARVDVNALLDQVDIEELVAKVDLASTMASTATSAAEDAVGSLRATAARGDAVTARWADRVIGRRPA
jgi:ribosomal protein L12E/L44/L45/RPP1/RPP2